MSPLAILASTDREPKFGEVWQWDDSRPLIFIARVMEGDEGFTHLFLDETGSLAPLMWDAPGIRKKWKLLTKENE